MTDITRKLELMANLKPGDPWPSADLGGNEYDYVPAINAMCAEALAEITRLRCDVTHLAGSRDKWVTSYTAEPWGSPYAMNTENWK